MKSSGGSTGVKKAQDERHLMISRQKQRPLKGRAVGVRQEGNSGWGDGVREQRQECGTEWQALVHAVPFPWACESRSAQQPAVLEGSRSWGRQ